MKKSFILLAVLCLSLPSLTQAQALWQLDFGKKDSSATTWMKQQGFELQQDAQKIQLQFGPDRLIFTTPEDTLGLFSKELKVPGAKRLRIVWGVEQYPQGANWEQKIFREAISVVLSFGTEKIDSGSFVIPNVPYFVSFFLGEKETQGKAYVGNYFKKGGRYFCLPCGPPKGKTVTTDVALDQLFKQEFGKTNLPPVTGIAFEIDTRDTKGQAQAFIQSIELLP